MTATQTRTGRRHTNFLEAHQAMRATLDTLTRDTRVGGACLPTDGQFIALEGTDGAEGDTITIRAGIFEDQTCVVTTLTEAAPVGGTEVEVESAVGFRPEMIAYIRHPNGGGQLFEITAAEGVGLGFNEGLVQNFPVGSSVYAIEERTYALDRSDPDNPILTLTIDRGVPRPFAGGLQDLQVRYLLDRNCLPVRRRRSAGRYRRVAHRPQRAFHGDGPSAAGGGREPSATRSGRDQCREGPQPAAVDESRRIPCRRHPVPSASLVRAHATHVGCQPVRRHAVVASADSRSSSYSGPCCCSPVPAPRFIRRSSRRR